MTLKERLWDNELNRTIMLGLIIACITLIFSIVDYYTHSILNFLDIFEILRIRKTYPLIEDIVLVVDARALARIVLAVFFFIGTFFALLTYMDKQGHIPGWKPIAFLTFITECLTYILWDYGFTKDYTEWWHYLQAWHTIYVFVGIFLFVVYANYSTSE